MSKQVSNKEQIYYWPDGSWLTRAEYNEVEHQYKGQDYGIMFVDFSTYATDEELYAGIDKLVGTVNSFWSGPIA